MVGSNVKQHLIAVGAALALALAVVIVGACGRTESGDAPARDAQADDAYPWPREQLDEGYAGSDSCRDCHEHNHATWFASYHRRMTQAASPEAILAPWEGNTPFEGDTGWRLEREGDAFFATPIDPTGREHLARMEVALTTGSHHYQIYWLKMREPGSLMALPFVWHLGDEAWETRASQFLFPPREAGSFEIDRWQSMCIKCHTTNGTPEHAPSGAPRVAEYGISCEACHGPGAAHVQARRAAESGEESVLVDAITNPAALGHERSAMVCGQCHGVRPFRTTDERERWREDGFDYRPGDDLAATRELLRGDPARNSEAMNRVIGDEHRAQLFWPDGEVRVSGREFNGLVESPCYQRGEMDCLSCHSMHPARLDPRPLSEWASDQLAPGMDGSAACTQCHDDLADDERASEHTHHAAGSSGAACMNCHMPYTTYGLTKAIRSHTVTSPSVATSLATGRPNACNSCHLDKSLGWTADRLRDWYGHERPELAGDREEVADAVVLGLSGDAGQRALVAWALGWEPAREASGTGWMPYLTSALAMDEYDAVARVALATARLDPRYRSLDLDLTLRDARRVAPVMETLVADWVREGLRATDEQRAAVLVRPDGTLDRERARALIDRRDARDVRLAE